MVCETLVQGEEGEKMGGVGVRNAVIVHAWDVYLPV